MYCTVVLATPLALKASVTARPPASQATAVLLLGFSAAPPTRTGSVPLPGFVYAQVKVTALLTLAKAGTHTVALSDLRTALTLTVCAASAAWFGTSKRKPLSAAVNVQPGLPNVQLVLLVGDGAGPLMPSTTLPAVVSCMSSVTEPLPIGMLKPAPLGQFTVMPVPLAVSVPVTPARYGTLQAASWQAAIVSVAGLQVTPLPLPWRISRWCSGGVQVCVCTRSSAISAALSSKL